MTDRRQEIQASYKELGGKFGNLYESILTYSSPVGKIMNKMMWGFNEETTTEWLNVALAGIPDDFCGRLLDIKTPKMIQFNYSTAAYLQAG